MEFAVSASPDGSIRVWDLAMRAELICLLKDSDGVGAVAISRNGRFVVAGLADKTAKVWDLWDGTEPKTLGPHLDSASAIAVTADGGVVLVGSGDRITVWERTTGHQRVLADHSGLVSGIAVSSDGRRAISASIDGTLQV